MGRLSEQVQKEPETGAFSPIKVYMKVKRKDAVFAEHTIQRCLLI